MISQKLIDKIEQRLNWLQAYFYNTIEILNTEIAESADYIDRSEIHQLEFEEIEQGENWGSEWSSAWFRAEYELADNISDRDLFLAADLGGESIVYIDGLAAGAIDREHNEIPLQDRELVSGKHQVLIQSYCGHEVPDYFSPSPTDIDPNMIANDESLYRIPSSFSYIKLVERNKAAWKLYYDLATLLGTAKEQDKNSLRFNQLIKKLSKAVDLIDWETEDKVKQNKQFNNAAEFIQAELEKRNSPTTPSLNLIGHAHIDVAWLWPLKETRKKSGRTFATQLRMFKKYPEFKFLQSQPQLYKYLEEDYPEIYSRVKEEIEAGNWEPEGGMWVESDTNVPAVESLIRQFLYGKKYFNDKFGAESKVLWLPDVFGYSGNLPQIMKGCDVDYFITSKIGWNDTNRFPYDLFKWQGIDGSEVLTHFIKTTYNGEVDPYSVQQIWQEFNQPEDSERVIHSIGYGDGGGGITMEHLEYARRQQDLEGQPKLEFGFIREFMDELNENREEYPDWQGELYLEYHRGTYTSQALTKWYNRKLEIKLRNTEILGVMARGNGFDYPAEELESCWKDLLVNQFHDILPGTSIAEVYQDTVRMYQEIDEKLDRIIENSIESLLEDEVRDEYINVWNLLVNQRDSIIRLDLADIENRMIIDDAGRSLPVQVVENQLIFMPVEPLPAMGVNNYKIQDATENQQYVNENIVGPVRVDEISNGDILYKVENNRVSLSIDRYGRLVSFIDKDRNRELTKETESLNQLILAEDLPRNWDAWDIEDYYFDKAESLKPEYDIELIAAGPLEVRIRFKGSFGEKSKLSQDIIIQADSRRIDFETEIDWQERHKLLKVEFPFDIHTDQAVYEIQGGYLKRPVHDNTSWDRARFEVPAQRWAALEEPDFGAALINDSKYGYQAIDNRLMLTLLKSATGPDRQADQGYHKFTYSVLPYQEGVSHGLVNREAADLNNHYIVSNGKSSYSNNLLDLDRNLKGIELLAIKEAENSNGIIIRLNETSGRRQFVSIDLKEKYTEITEVNMIEREQANLAGNTDHLKIEFKPFEIKTIKLNP
ncbi:alpha-mannosidase [Halanaerobiaceae bacterium Z-7014]|uniref:Alpha-mannosidase n=1 Tax=Halonatronomonas betaini TaxID=2778430 RepID=A0A931F771_9FIRM|nr:glycoside hydrolase family 38 C-terminal domain-containing protein [Halonatronomonas betaini]MBF8436331.1 alpha-mannosidase [Halonatronomonas betaini]